MQSSRRVEHTATNRPILVSKSTSGAQTEEYPVLVTSSFTTPDTLMLDSYTQTNEKDRLSTELIKCKKSTTTEAQTDFTGSKVVPTSSNVLANNISVDKGVANNIGTTRGIVNDIVKPSDRALTKKVSFSLQTEDFEPPFRDSDDRPSDQLNAPVSFEIKRNCRHGNERGQCQQCNTSVVHKKFKSPLADHYSPVVKTETEKTSLLESTKVDPKQEDNDSGQESDTAAPVRLSYNKLANIRHLAKAKLKEIKRPNKNMTHSLDKLGLAAAASEERHSALEEIQSKTHKKRRPRIHDGIESLTLQDLPALVESTPQFKNATDTDEEMDEYNGNYGSKTTKYGAKSHEKRELSDVTRAKNFIKHCINTPVATESSDSYKHKTRTRRRDSGVSSLPRISNSRRCESEARNKRARGIADDVESRKCVSEVPNGKMTTFDVNYKAYINALERIVDSNLSTLAQAEKYYHKM